MGWAPVKAGFPSWFQDIYLASLSACLFVTNKRHVTLGTVNRCSERPNFSLKMLYFCKMLKIQEKTLFKRAFCPCFILKNRRCSSCNRSWNRRWGWIIFLQINSQFYQTFRNFVYLQGVPRNMKVERRLCSSEIVYGIYLRIWI